MGLSRAALVLVPDAERCLEQLFLGFAPQIPRFFPPFSGHPAAFPSLHVLYSPSQAPLCPLGSIFSKQPSCALAKVGAAPEQRSRLASRVDGIWEVKRPGAVFWDQMDLVDGELDLAPAGPT